MSDDTISRQAAITIPVTPKEDREYQTFNLDDAYEQAWDDLQKRIEQLPSAQRTGRWIPVAGRMGKEVQCDCCGEVFWYWLTNFTYCPNCGCAMKGEEE